MSSIFLSAHWTNLLVVNFETDKKFLEQYLPAGTEPNDWNGSYFMSLVGFQFSKTKLFGIPSPFFKTFPELNLRFYVKRKINNSWRNGVVFIKEIAPSKLVGLMAGWLYHENFISLPMKSNFDIINDEQRIEYCWKVNGKWNFLKSTVNNNPGNYNPESLEYFICNHYRGYTRVNETKTKEFEVIHRPWNIHPVNSFEINLDAAAVYGNDAAAYLSQSPFSTFLMDGSETKVTKPVSIKVE
jgi:uncharacterized protein YqjF (DUF2071 family)